MSTTFAPTSENQMWLSAWETVPLPSGLNAPEKRLNILDEFFSLDIPKGETILVPLCGKTIDMLVMAEHGYKVVGIELSEIATKDFFVENDIPYQITIHPTLCYSSENIKIFVGDFFNISLPDISCAGFYDVAALIAISPLQRRLYINRISELLSQDAIGYLVSVEHQMATSNPPYSIAEKEINAIYSNFEVTKVQDFEERDLISSNYCLTKKDSFSLLPTLDEVLTYKNDNLIKRYQKDFPDNALSAKDALSNVIKYLWLGQKLLTDQENLTSINELNFQFYLQYEMKEIDDMWHTFLLFTIDYREFCYQYFGYYIDHVPTVETDEATQNIKHETNPDEEMQKWLSYVYDNLGEDTLKMWFPQYFEKK